MGKYSPLKDFLAANAQDYVPMTFAEIEKVLGSQLPASKQYPGVVEQQSKQQPDDKKTGWRPAIETEAVNTASGKLVFRRVKNRRLTVRRFHQERRTANARPLHPGIGFMKGSDQDQSRVSMSLALFPMSHGTKDTLEKTVCLKYRQESSESECTPDLLAGHVRHALLGWRKPNGRRNALGNFGGSPRRSPLPFTDVRVGNRHRRGKGADQSTFGAARFCGQIYRRGCRRNSVR